MYSGYMVLTIDLIVGCHSDWIWFLQRYEEKKRALCISKRYSNNGWMELIFIMGKENDFGSWLKQFSKGTDVHREQL